MFYSVKEPWLFEINNQTLNEYSFKIWSLFNPEKKTTRKRRKKKWKNTWKSWIYFSTLFFLFPLYKFKLKVDKKYWIINGKRKIIHYIGSQYKHFYSFFFFSSSVEEIFSRRRRRRRKRRKKTNIDIKIHSGRQRMRLKLKRIF